MRTNILTSIKDTITLYMYITMRVAILGTRNKIN